MKKLTVLLILISLATACSEDVKPLKKIRFPRNDGPVDPNPPKPLKSNGGEPSDPLPPNSILEYGEGPVDPNPPTP